MKELGVKRRLVMRLKGFSSTFRRRDLCKASGGFVSGLLHLKRQMGMASRTLFRLIEQRVIVHISG